MAWVKMDDSFPDHPKVVEAGDAAAWLYVKALCYSGKYLTDGQLTEAQVRRLALGDVDAITALVRVGLWERTEGGYLIHDYHEYQPSAEHVRRERDEARARMAQRRSPDVPPDDDPGSPEVHPNNGRTHGEVQAPRTRSRSRTPSDTHAEAPVAADAAPPARRPSPREPAETNLAPLFEAFTARGLPRPVVFGAEARAAAELLRHVEAEAVAGCWQDMAAGEYGDDFDRRKLSFAYLARENRVANWQRWKAGGQAPPRRIPMNGTARVQPTAGQEGWAPVDEPSEEAREQCRRISACSGRAGPHHKHCPDNPRWGERRATA